MNVRLVLLLALPLLLACGVTKGVVTAKHYLAAHYNTYYVSDYREECRTYTTTDSKGKTSTSTTCQQVYIGSHPVTYFVADDWTLDLRATDGSTGTVDVSKGVFEQAQVGDTYDADTGKLNGD